MCAGLFMHRFRALTFVSPVDVPYYSAAAMFEFIRSAKRTFHVLLFSCHAVVEAFCAAAERINSNIAVVEVFSEFQTLLNSNIAVVEVLSSKNFLLFQKRFVNKGNL